MYSGVSVGNHHFSSSQLLSRWNYISEKSCCSSVLPIAPLTHLPITPPNPPLPPPPLTSPEAFFFFSNVKRELALQAIISGPAPAWLKASSLSPSDRDSESSLWHPDCTTVSGSVYQITRPVPRGCNLGWSASLLSSQC